MKNVLVTGGLGYIGSHTVVELHNSGYNPIIIDNLSNSRIEILERVTSIIDKKPTFYEADVLDEAKLSEILSENEIISVIHFAASKAVGESVAKPLLYYKNNISTTVNLLDAMKTHEIPYFIFSSSCTVYGEPDVLPVTENTPIKRANSPYGNTKQICEEVIQDATNANPHINAISLRYFNPIGAHSSGVIGELPQGIPNNLMPYLLKVVSGELEKLSVFGNDYNTPDGSCIRDYIHVVDLAKAHVKALNRLEEGSNKTNHECFNVGTGEGYSVLDLINTFEKETGEKVNYEITDRRPGDVEKIYADPTFAKTELKWEAGLDLNDMVKSAWNWYQKFKNG